MKACFNIMTAKVNSECHLPSVTDRGSDGNDDDKENCFRNLL